MGVVSPIRSHLVFRGNATEREEPKRGTAANAGIEGNSPQIESRLKIQARLYDMDNQAIRETETAIDAIYARFIKRMKGIRRKR